MSRNTRAVNVALCLACGLSAAVRSAAAEERGTVEGVVTSREGRQLAGARVRLGGALHSTATDLHGRFRIAGVTVGEHVLVVQRDGFAAAERRVSIAAAEPLRVEIVLDPAPAFAEQVTVTASREEEAAEKLPVAIGVVSGDEIRQMRPEHIAEPLNRVAGVHIVAFSGDGAHNSVRQPLCCRPTILLLEDGVPFSSPAFYSTSQIKLVNYAQSAGVEVLRGPGTAVYGSDGLTGVINFRTQDPPVARQGDISLEAGGAGFRRVLGSGGGTLGRHGFHATLNYTEADGRRQDPWQRKSGALVWTASIGGGAFLRTVFSANDTHATGTDDQTPEQFATRSDFNPYPTAYSDFSSYRLSSSYVRPVGAGSLSIMPFVRFNDVDFVPGWQLSYDPVVWQWDERSGGLRSQLRRPLGAGGGVFAAGVDLDYTDGARREPVIDPVEVDGVWVDWSLTRLPPAYDYDFTFRGAAAYAQYEFSPVRGLSVTAGGRFDLAGYDYTSRLGPLQTGFKRRPADAERTYRQFTPKLGLTWAASDAVTVLAGYRRGFRVPLEQQLFKQGASLNTLDLEPVKADSVEAGFRANVSGRVRAEVVGYALWLKDDILSFRSVEGVSELKNNGQTRHLGVEVTLGAALRTDLRFHAAWTFAKHTFTDWQPSAELDLSGHEMDGAPRHQRSAQLTWSPSFLKGGRVQAEYLGLSDYWLDPANTLRQDGYDVLHLRASYVIGRRFEVFGRLINAFDRLYAAQAFQGFGDIPRLLSPAEYRTFYGGVVARF